MKIKAKNVNVYYGEKHAIKNVSLHFAKNTITSLIGPSGCGKSTFLRCINRMNDTIPICKVTGKITLDKQDIFDPELDVVELRARIGMVFQKPNPFPKSIYDNILYGPIIHGTVSRSKSDRDNLVEDCLKKTALWDEVKDRLKDPATSLSGGQQQRLCIARAIATRPEVILMDEPCSALDPIATAKIEILMEDLAKEYTIIIVTHSMSQAQRISTHTAFFYLGEIIEFSKTKKLFNKPRLKKTENYINGVFG